MTPARMLTRTAARQAEFPSRQCAGRRQMPLIARSRLAFARLRLFSRNLAAKRCKSGKNKWVAILQQPSPEAAKHTDREFVHQAKGGSEA
jgi:hypothetical protein